MHDTEVPDYRVPDYEAPRLDELGQLLDLTLGSGTACDDGSGFSAGEFDESTGECI